MDPENSSNSASREELLHDKVAKWRSKLLDIGNRNPLVSCSFNPSRGVIEIVTPDSERIWRSLAADSEAGADPMRFPWRRELVPPPAGEGQNSGPKKARLAKDVLFSESSDPGPVSLSPTPTANEPVTAMDWNPSLDECRMSPRLRETDLLTEMSDRVIERRLRTVDGHARLAMSEQGVHVLYIAFGFLKWFESKDSEDERRSPLILVPG